MSQQQRILVVDDLPMNVEILVKLLQREKYCVATAYSGEECLASIEGFRPQLVLLDIMMPGMNGYEVCRLLKGRQDLGFLQVILVSGKGSTTERIKGYQASADDYLVKPFDHDELLSKVRAHYRLWHAQTQLEAAHDELEQYSRDLETLVVARTNQLTVTQDVTLFSLAKLADSRDPETGEHLIRIRSYCDILARELHAAGPYRDEIDSKFIDDLYRASPLHDIGKVGIRDAILMKPGRLTAEEFEEMKKHVLLGAETLEDARDQAADFGHFLSMAVEITRYHHERWNGTGYCAGLKGTEIPLSARIVALADVFDALTSKRCYKPAYTPECAYDVIVGESEKHFDPVIVEAFQRRFQDFVARVDSAARDAKPAIPLLC